MHKTVHSAGLYNVMYNTIVLMFFMHELINCDSLMEKCLHVRPEFHHTGLIVYCMRICMVNVHQLYVVVLY